MGTSLKGKVALVAGATRGAGRGMTAERTIVRQETGRRAGPCADIEPLGSVSSFARRSFAALSDRPAGFMSESYAALDKVLASLGATAH